MTTVASGSFIRAAQEEKGPGEQGEAEGQGELPSKEASGRGWAQPRLAFPVAPTTVLQRAALHTKEAQGTRLGGV